MAILKRKRKTDDVTVYVIDYRTSDGTRVREKAGYSREAAKRLLQKRLGEDSVGTLNRNRKSATPFREFSKVFLEKHAATCERPDWYEWLVNAMVAEFGDTPLRNVSAFRVQGYINRLTQRDEADEITNGTTLGHHRRAVHNVFARAVEWGYLSTNPTKGVKTPSASPPPERFLTEEEAGRLRAAATGDMVHFVRLMLNTGLRPGEALALEWTDCRRTDPSPHLLVRRSKTGKPRWVPLNADALTALDDLEREIKPGCAFVFRNRKGDGRKRSNKTAFKAACRRAGLRYGLKDADGVTRHSLRHTAISWMLQRGASLYAVGKIVGHSGASMTERYGHLTDSHLTDAVRRLDTPVDTCRETRENGKAVSA
jgi:integrase